MNNIENPNNCCNLECCMCKKIFMALVILILTFMAGIMVGNSGRCHYSDHYYQKQKHYSNSHSQKPKKFHKGMHQIPTSKQSPSSSPLSQGGFIIEIDEID